MSYKDGIKLDILKGELKFWKLVIERTEDCIKLGGERDVSHFVYIG